MRSAAATPNNSMRTVPNIGPRERRARLLIGGVALSVGVAIAAVLVLTGITRWWRLLLALPFWIGALGVSQAFERT